MSQAAIVQSDYKSGDIRIARHVRGGNPSLAFIGKKLKTLWTSWFFFAVTASALMVGCRIVFFDHLFFRARLLPNHDMVVGLSYFATNMHSLRLSGEIAWWNPLAQNGFAQYYQSFLGPLAPTPHHPVFVLWVQAMAGLRLLHVSIPEYTQYLIVNYAVLPFLTFLAFTGFVGQLFRHRATVLLLLIVYTFSGIGLWNSAWFYFQESFSLFFLLGSALAWLHRPTVGRLFVLLAAVLVQLCSANYWTVYNSWLIGILFAAYVWIYPVRVRRAARRVLAWASAAPIASTVLIGSVALTVGLWVILLGSMAAEQNDRYVRSRQETYTKEDAYNRERLEDAYQRGLGPWSVATQLFDSALPTERRPDRVSNEIHSARYVGSVLLPLLLVALARRWTRRDRFLIATAVGVLIVCLAPPFLLLAWDRMPFMKRVAHLFYFYSHHGQLLMVLMSGVGLEALLRIDEDAAGRRRLAWLTGGLLVLMGLVFAGAGALSFQPGYGPVVGGILWLAVLVGVCCLVIWQQLAYPSPQTRRLMTFVLVALAAADLTHYFWKVSRSDAEYSKYLHSPNPIPEEVRAKLLKPWAPPDPNQGFEAGVVQNMPLYFYTWPVNRFMYSRGMKELLLFPSTFHGLVLRSHPMLVLQEGRDADGNTDSANALEPSYQGAISKWSYNSFSLRVNAATAGWLYIPQLYDPLWHVTIDGQVVCPKEAGFVGMAFPIDAGTHLVHMDYRPLARRLYWLACLIVEGILLTLGVLWLRAGRRRSLS